MKGDDYMNERQSKYKWLWLIIVSTFPFMLAIIFYPINLCLLFPYVSIILTAINYHFIEKTLHYVLIQVYILVCMICSCGITIYLYYINISNDPMTPAVGIAIALFSSVIFIIFNSITVYAKIRTNKPKENDK